MPTRDECWELLTEWTLKEGLRTHALAVEAAMRGAAARFGGDPDEWGCVGLIHDFDYERYPEPADHPARGVEILREKGWPEPWLQAVMGHGNHTGVARETMMAKALFAVDELCGFITAVALVRPSKSVADVEIKSVKKKMKDKAFAAAVNRDEIRQGAAELGVELDELIQLVLDAMKGSRESLGL